MRIGHESPGLTTPEALWANRIRISDAVYAVYRFAENSIAISFRHEEVHKLCRSYAVDAVPLFAIRINQADIDFERAKSAQEDIAEGHSVRNYSDAYLETLAVYRKIAEKMPFFDTFLFHGSAIAVNGQAYIFTAKSGTGKSTHTRLWRELLGDRAVMVNDDKPLMKVYENGTAMVYGTPWDGKHRLSNNMAVPVRSICILERASENHIREICKAEALPMLLRQTYRPADPAALAKTLALLDRLNIKLYRLGCNMDISAAALSYNTMKEE